MIPPQFVAAYDPFITVSGIVEDDALVIVAWGDGTVTVHDPVMEGVTWTLAVSEGAGESDEAPTWIWTGRATVSGDLDFDIGFTGGGAWAAQLFQYRGSDGFGAVASARVDGVPTVDIDTLKANSAVVANIGDQNFIDGSGRLYVETPGVVVERTYFRLDAFYTIYAARWNDVGAPGTKTVGLSAPGGQHATICAVEVFGSLPPVIPVRIRTPDEILTGNRNTKYRLDVLDADESPVTTLDGVTDGELEWIANAMVKGAGSIVVKDVDQSIDWLNARLRPVMLIEGLPEQPLGVYLAAEAPEDWDRGRTWRVKLLDKTTIPDQDTVAETYALASGTVVTTAIIDLLDSCGVTNYAVTTSATTLAAPLNWPAGTKKLRVINDLLSYINYFSLYANFDGQLVAAPYILPANRPIRYEFIDGPTSIYNPNFNRNIDIWKIPNRVTVVSMGSGTSAALTSTQENNNPNSPYSIAARGRIIGYTEEGVEAANQTVLDAYAKRLLAEKTSPTASVEIAHAPVPGLAVNLAVRFRRTPAGIDARHVVSATKLTLRGSALALSTFREVVDV